MLAIRKDYLGPQRARMGGIHVEDPIAVPERVYRLDWVVVRLPLDLAARLRSSG